MRIVPIGPEDYMPWLMHRHYAKRRPPVSHAYGAYEDGCMIGVVTYGVPASSPLRDGVCGPDWSDCVLELNRLCCNSRKNLASKMVSASLKMLPRPSVVVSYADTSMGHVGYVYQACNFLYTGLSAKRTDWHIEGMGLHGVTIADKTRGMKNRAQAIREMYGDAFSLRDRPRKHRYIYLVGSKSDKRAMMSALRYPVMPYPKGGSNRYDASYVPPTQGKFF